MRIPGRNKPDDPIQKLTDSITERMQSLDASSDEYSELLRHLERLYDLRLQKRREPIKMDTIAIVVGNLFGLILIVAYEQKHVWTSKATSQVIKPRTPDIT